MAHFEIHVLNYNGARYLPRCLQSIQGITSGPHTTQVNVVDNGSCDESAALVASEFPQYRFMDLESNLGYSAGNNAGAWRAAAARHKLAGSAPDYHVFLNNDTEVGPDWLGAAAEILEKEPRTGIVGSKSLFLDHFVVLRIVVTPPFEPHKTGSLDTRRLGAFVSLPIEGQNIHPDSRRIRWKEAFQPEESGRWIPAESQIFLPVLDIARPMEVNLRLRFVAEHGEQISIECFLNSSKSALLSRDSRGGETVEIKLKFAPCDYTRVIQNIGSFVTPRWDAGDIGFGEVDRGQYDTLSDVSAICGVSMFIRHELFKKLRGFDQRYFAYFEDTDLSVRARLLGYQCKVVPTSVLGHLHCGSSGGEGSELFNRLVAFSHLYFSSKFVSPAQWRERLKELSQAARDQFDNFVHDRRLSDKPQLQARLRYRKLMHLFALNRLYRFRNADALARFPFRDRAGKLVEDA